MSTMSRFSKKTASPKKAATKIVNQVKAWSFSRYLEYAACPLKYKLHAIDKIKEPSNVYAEHGITAHARGEHFLKGSIKQVPDEFKNFKSEMMELRKAGAVPEYDLAVTKSWSPTTYDDWNNVWCRAKADAVVVGDDDCFIIDYKTGKEKDNDPLQMELYAVLAMAHYPKVKSFFVELWYLGSSKVTANEYSRKDEKKLRKDWEKRVAPMFKDTTFKPKENDGCRFCFFSKDKTGKCPIR